MSLPSCILCTEDKLHLEKKRPQPKGRDVTLVWDNKKFEVWAFLFQNLAKWDERNIDRPKYANDLLILFTNGHYDHPLLNPYFDC